MGRISGRTGTASTKHLNAQRVASTIRCVWGASLKSDDVLIRDGYILQWRQAPSEKEMQRAEHMLALVGAPSGDVSLHQHEVNPVDLNKDQHVESCLIMTRGFASAWSTIATEIAHHCGLKNLYRLERMRLLTAPAPAKEADWEKLYDRLLEEKIPCSTDWEAVVLQALASADASPSPPLLSQAAGSKALDEANRKLGLGLDERKKHHLLRHYAGLKREPTDTELMTFALFHSEHCRHGIFNAGWCVAGLDMDQTLFDIIRSTTTMATGHRVLSAYNDNAAVLRGFQERTFIAPDEDYRYRHCHRRSHIVLKVETHNHPTAICPRPGAATGAGGELRDEAATGRGAAPGAGMVGYSVSVSGLSYADGGSIAPDQLSPQLASAGDIMREAPLGAAAYNNEFGRPVLCGYFRSYERNEDGFPFYGYFKPIMIAGGHGSIAETQISKQPVRTGLMLVLSGGPSFRIGLGGGTASSASAGTGDADADFASVQRGQAEMQRRCQEVINRCHEMGPMNPIISVHDVGAGGLANAVPEILDRHGAELNLKAIHVATGMNPMEIWCNESQERFILLLDHSDIDRFARLCERENAPYAVIGEVTEKDGMLRLTDGDQKTKPALELSMPWLCEPLPEPTFSIRARAGDKRLETPDVDHDPPLAEAARRILSTPTVGDKTFLITIGDRSVGGLVVRDQMVGPWQVPVADCSVTADAYESFTGVAMAVGERAPIATQDPAASVRMAIVEALTNLCPARILNLNHVALSANWMAAADTPERKAELRAGVQAAGDLCRALGIPIPVGKDSLSMRAHWEADGREHDSVSPLSLVVTAVAPVIDIRGTLTPQLQPQGDLILVDLGDKRDRLGASILQQCYPQRASVPTPDITDPDLIVRFFRTAQLLNETGYLTAWHDRSDGGLFACLCEMAFAAHMGIDVHLDDAAIRSPAAQLFSEEAGVVMQTAAGKSAEVLRQWREAGMTAYRIGTVNTDNRLRVHCQGRPLYDESIPQLRAYWSRYDYMMRTNRDDPECAAEEYRSVTGELDRGLYAQAPAPQDISIPVIGGNRPKLAVLRTQGVNGQREMAAAFDRAGFDCFDLHMTDLVRGEKTLAEYNVLAVPGGFSYGDVLGAGYGWAMSILHNERLRDVFSEFFARTHTLSFGACNGCQMLTHLRVLIPGSNGWSPVRPNRSRRFEGRLVMVEITQSNPSVLFAGMGGWRLPVPVAHGEGRMAAVPPEIACMRYTTQTYPHNPNGSDDGLTGICSADGRVTAVMPHPERAFLNWQLSWSPSSWRGANSPWMQLFRNARHWVDNN